MNGLLLLLVSCVCGETVLFSKNSQYFISFILSFLQKRNIEPNVVVDDSSMHSLVVDGIVSSFLDYSSNMKYENELLWKYNPKWMIYHCGEPVQESILASIIDAISTNASILLIHSFILTSHFDDKYYVRKQYGTTNVVKYCDTVSRCFFSVYIPIFATSFSETVYSKISLNENEFTISPTLLFGGFVMESNLYYSQLQQTYPSKHGIAYLYNNCDVQYREEFYDTLKLCVNRPNFTCGHLDDYGVFALGRCRGSKDRWFGAVSRFNHDYLLDALIQYFRYSLVVALESAPFLSGYITEKLWLPLLAGAVPIYHGNMTEIMAENQNNGGNPICNCVKPCTSSTSTWSSEHCIIDICKVDNGSVLQFWFELFWDQISNKPTDLWITLFSWHPDSEKYLNGYVSDAWKEAVVDVFGE